MNAALAGILRFRKKEGSGAGKCGPFYAAFNYACSDSVTDIATFDAAFANSLVHLLFYCAGRRPKYIIRRYFYTRVVNRNMDWYGANKYCTDRLGGNLATIKYLSLQKRIGAYVSRLNGQHYFCRSTQCVGAAFAMATWLSVCLSVCLSR